MPNSQPEQPKYDNIMPGDLVLYRSGIKKRVGYAVEFTEDGGTVPVRFIDNQPYCTWVKRNKLRLYIPTDQRTIEFQRFCALYQEIQKAEAWGAGVSARTQELHKIAKDYNFTIPAAPTPPPELPPSEKRTPPNLKDEIVTEALKIVNGARREAYAGPERSFDRIAKLWNAYLSTKGIDAHISPRDVAMLQLLLKVARLVETSNHQDSMVDIVGYLLCYAEIVTEEKSNGRKSC